MTGSAAVGFGYQLPNEGISDEWYTPPSVIEAIGLEYDLDPCTPRGGLPWIPAKRTYSLPDDNGLWLPWSGRVWLNPPYGREVPAWMDRLVAHGHGIALIFARTDTAWFQRAATAADVICLIAGRLHFVRPDLTPAPFNSGAPSCLLAFGSDCAEAVERTGLGLMVRS